MIHLVTGRAGQNHITSLDQGSYNAGTLGLGKYVLQTGSVFTYQIVSNNLIKIRDGDLVNQGRHINIPVSSYEECQIDNGEQSVKRNDLIVVRYTLDTASGLESAALVVIKGTAGTTGTDPSYVKGDILSGDTVDDFPLYRVRLDATNIEGIDALYDVVSPYAEHEHNYAGAPSPGGAATSATKLQTPRLINNVAFDGTANITIADNTKLPLTGGFIGGNLHLNNNRNETAEFDIYSPGPTKAHMDVNSYGVAFGAYDTSWLSYIRYTHDLTLDSRDRVFINKPLHMGTNFVCGYNGWAMIGLNAVEDIHLATTSHGAQAMYLHLNNNNNAASTQMYRFTMGYYDAGFNDKVSLGTSTNRWTTVYATTGVISTSDRNKKKEIKDIAVKYKKLFRDIRPVTYKLRSSKEATHDRVHFGVVSQEVEELMEKHGISPLEFAAFCKDQAFEYDTDEDGGEIPESKRVKLDKDGNPVYEYSFRYQEMTMLNTSMIQDALNTIDVLQAEVDQQQRQIDTMEEQLANALRRIEQLEKA